MKNMWKEYSIGFIKGNRASSISVLAAAFISALFLSLLCGLFYNFWNYEIEAVVLEEGDWQGRVSGTAYDRAGFTNLTIDHLDFHKTMENYFNAKKILFEKYMRNNWQGSVNIDDEYGRRLRDFLGKRAITYAMLDESADFFASIKNFSLDGLDIEIKMPGAGGVKALKLPLLGGYNVLNALQALSLAWSVGVSANCALDALAHMPQVPGRLERYKIEGGGTCVIDFAHTSDGLEKVLTAVRPICRGRLIAVFGAGGDRDRTKRPIMGEIASRLADNVIVTSDNPRTEEPM